MAPGMSNVVREAFERCWAQRDVEEALRLVDDDATLDWSNSRAPYGGMFRGHAQIADALRILWEAWEEFTPTVVEAIEVEPDTVVLVTRVTARGKGSGVTVNASGGSVWTVRDGKITRGKLYQSKAEALDAIGRGDRT